MIDGVSAMDTGNNGLMGGLEPAGRRVRRGQGHHVGLSGRVRPVERPADLGRHAQRHQPVPVVRCSPTSAIRASNANALGQRAQRQPERDVTADRRRIYVRRPSRQARRQQQAVLLLQPRVPAPANRQLHQHHACFPTALERRGDFSETRDQNGKLYNLIYDPHSGLPKNACSAGDDARLLPRRRHPRPIPSTALYGPGWQSSISIRCPTSLKAVARATTTRSSPRSSSRSVRHPVDPRGLPASSRFRLTGKWVGATSLVQPTIGTPSGLQRHAAEISAVVQHLGHSHLQRPPDDVPRSDLRASTRTGSGRRPSASGATGTTSSAHQTWPASYPSARRRDCASLFPDAVVVDPRYYEYGALQEVGRALLRRRARACCRPQLAWAAPARPAAFRRSAATTALARRRA